MKWNTQTLTRLIDQAENGELVYSNKKLTGLSNQSLTALLQMLANCLSPNEVYLEVGVFQGLSLLSVAKANPDISCIGIDNFSQFDHDRINHSMVINRAREIGCKNFEIINKDFEIALKNLNDNLHGKSVGLYFIDGPHDYRSQLMCLELIKPYLSPNAIIIIDDCNYLHVRQATVDFVNLNSDFKLFFQTYSIAHPHNLEKNQRDKWWNGVNLIVKDSKSEIEGLEAPIDSERKIFFSDHEYMSSMMPLHINKINDLVVSLMRFNLFLFLKNWYSLQKIRRSDKGGKYNSRNTYSENLEYERISK